MLVRTALLIWLAWRSGHLSCSWLFPHFSVVELFNNLMRRATGKPNLWERRPLPDVQPDGSRQGTSRWCRLPTLVAVLGFAFTRIRETGPHSGLR